MLKEKHSVLFCGNPGFNKYVDYAVACKYIVQSTDSYSIKIRMRNRIIV